MNKLINKFKVAFKFESILREEAIKTCITNEIPLTEDNILNVIEMIQFRKDRTNIT